MILKVSKNELFEKWLEWLNPIFTLGKTDRKILAAYITLHYLHYSRYSKEVLDELLMSEDTKKIVAKRLKLSTSVVDKTLKKFKENNIIIDNSLHPSLVAYPKNNKFKINIEFEVV